MILTDAAFGESISTYHQLFKQYIPAVPARSLHPQAVWSHFSPAQGNHFQSEWEFLSPGVVRGQVLDKADITACDSKRSAITNPQTGELRVSRLFQDMGKKGPERCAVGRAGSVADLPHHIKSIGGQKEALAWGQMGLTDNFTSGQIGWKD